MPRILRVEASEVILYFYSSESYRLPSQNSHSSLPVGFVANFFESSSGQCLNACSNHGKCVQGECECETTSEIAWYGDDCSVPVRNLNSEAPVTIKDIPVGSWSYWMFTLEQNVSNVVIELLSTGPADSDPFLLFSLEGPPTLTPNQFSHVDWYDWYYESNDVHLVREHDIANGTYFIGITNMRDRAKSPLSAQLTLRVSNDTTWNCIGDCFGHGTCQSDSGNCLCDEGWTGVHPTSLSFCKYPIIKADKLTDFVHKDTVRVGDWVYLEFDVPAESAGGALEVSLWSKNPKARPILLVNPGTLPTLKHGVVPSYDAFNSKFGDEPGFELLSGHQQSIQIQGSNLTAGKYYVGVSNVWGNTGTSIVSHGTAEVDIYINFNKQGKMCPAAQDQICSGHPCDFNTGKCQCPTNLVGRACGFAVTKVMPGQTLPVDTVNPGTFKMYAIEFTPEMLGTNVLIEVQKENPDDDNHAYLLARFGEVPNAPNYNGTGFDRHDLKSNFYSSPLHTILLDRELLHKKGPGIWYFSIENSAASESPLHFKLSVVASDQLSCPTNGSPLPCSGMGRCDESLGRCTCAPERTGEDCSSAGVWHIPRNSMVTWAPPIEPDGWAYYSIAIGCPDSNIQVAFRENDVTEEQISAPFLVMKKGKLPLMVEGTSDYYDYFRGMSDHASIQAIQVKPCKEPPCGLKPSEYGSVFEGEAPEPGIYFIGVYNDIKASGPINNYTVVFETLNSCPKDKPCAKGFVGDECEIPCPGMLPSQAYAQIDFVQGIPCSNAGQCTLVEGDVPRAVCECDEQHFGPMCERTCPGAQIDATGKITSVCNGRGKCALGSDGVNPECKCMPGFGGTDCRPCPGSSSPCNGNGMCSSSPEGEPVCKCKQGWAGPECTEQCHLNCNGHGTCQVIAEHDKQVPVCKCEGPWMGEHCEITCPGSNGGIFVNISQKYRTFSWFLKYDPSYTITVAGWNP